MTWTRRMKAPGRGLTIMELVVVAAISLMVLLVLWQIWRSSRRYEDTLFRHMKMQRGVRGAMAQVQHDLRELLELVELERGPTGSLAKMVFRVTEAANRAGPIKTVRYEFSREAPRDRFRRDGLPLFEDSLLDFQVYAFTLEDRPREVVEPAELSRVHLFKVRVTFVPGRSEFQNATQQRTFNFSIYPRVPASRRKSVIGRFGLSTGRFARVTSPPPGPTPEDLEP